MTLIQQQLSSHCYRLQLLVKAGYSYKDIHFLLSNYYGYKGSYRSLIRYGKKQVLPACIHVITDSDLKDIRIFHDNLIKRRKSPKKRNRRSLLSKYRTSLLNQYSKNISYNKTHNWFIKRHKINISYSAVRRYIIEVLY